MSQDGFKRFSDLPKQTVLAYAPQPKRTMPDSGFDGPEGRRQGGPGIRALLTGGVVGGGSAAPVVCPETYGKEYLKVCKEQGYNPFSQEDFFSSPKSLIFEIGTSCTLWVRLGYCPYNNILKVYIMRKNAGGNPSIVGLLYSEIGEVLQYMTKTMIAIDKATREKTPIFRSESGAYEKSNTLAYWHHEDTFYTSSATFRMRFQFTAGNVYECYINQPNDHSVLEGYFGYKIRLVAPDVRQLVDTLITIQNDCSSEGDRLVTE